jgi:glycosyltransferase involved in cell wall biosynthesis
VVKRLRILLINEFGSLNGGERSWLAILPCLSADCEWVTSVPAASELAAAISQHGIKNIPLQLAKSAHANRQAENDALLLQLIESVAPDIVHANSLHTSRMLGRVAGRLQMATVGHCRDMMRLTKTALAELGQLDRLICVSEAARNFLLSQNLPAENSVVIHNGVDLERFQPRNRQFRIQHALGLDPAARVLLNIGQIGMRKGLDMLLDAFSIVSQHFHDVHLLIVGQRWSGKDEAILFEKTLHSRAARQPLLGRVHFAGLRNDVANLMNDSTLLLHTARQEPLGRVLLEASASGLAVVATDVGGTREIFCEEGCADAALLIPPDQPLAFAKATCDLLDDAHRRQKLTRAARQRAEREFDVNLCARRTLQLYHELLG